VPRERDRAQETKAEARRAGLRWRTARSTAESGNPASPRLDQPKALRQRQTLRSRLDGEKFGQASENIARYFGTAQYLVIQSAIVVIWILLNIAVFTRAIHWDPYPFILLNLAFSTQAAYAAPLILLAQNRQAEHDKEEVERDRETNARALAETEYLAREIAAVRLAVDQKADRSDILEPLERLEAVLERLAPVAITRPASE
jgi:uncharacterized membrane protein